MRRSVIVGGIVLTLSWALATYFLFCLLARIPGEAKRPWLILSFLWHYRHIHAVRAALLLSALLSGVAHGRLAARLLGGKEPGPFGDARWAGMREMAKAGLLKGKGLLLARYGRRTLCMPGWEHLICFAPSGSGKGVGLVIPNLLHWPDSAIVHDVKGENFELTSGFRARHGQKVYFFNPGDPEGRTHRYNPFQFVSDHPGLRIDDLHKIAHLLLPNHEFWENEARTLLVGLALYLMEEPGSQVTFGNILCSIREANFAHKLVDLLAQRRMDLDPVAYMALNAFVQKAEKERSAVLSTLNAALELWANPLIDAATSTSDFDLRKLKRERATIYVGVTPNNLHRLRPLLQIFYQQATDILTEKKPDPQKEPYGVLFLMDEFASLGKMTQFEQASAYFRGYRVRFMMIIQDLPQLERHYDKAGLFSFMGMSKVKITFAADNYGTAEVISRFLGTYGIDKESRSDSRPAGFCRGGSSRSRSVSSTSRALLLPQEILQLPPDDAILLIEGMRPVRAKKIRYYEDQNLRRRIQAPIAIRPIAPITRTLSSGTFVAKPRVLSEKELDDWTQANESGQPETVSADEKC